MPRIAAAFALAFVVSIATSEARAQVSRFAPLPYGGTEVFSGASLEYPVANSYFYAPLTSTATYVPPYSYYVAPYPLPARPYVSYGSNDIFPYYGRPYGHPYDAWTWSYMSAYPTDYLARYYYPPVR